jgi:hypothetical protein
MDGQEREMIRNNLVRGYETAWSCLSQMACEESWTWIVLLCASYTYVCTSKNIVCLALRVTIIIVLLAFLVRPWTLPWALPEVPLTTIDIHREFLTEPKNMTFNNQLLQFRPRMFGKEAKFEEAFFTEAPTPGHSLGGPSYGDLQIWVRFLEN